VTEAVPLGLAQPAIRYGTAFALGALSAKRPLGHAVLQSPFERNGEPVCHQSSCSVHQEGGKQ
jgi:hypothetical protein